MAREPDDNTLDNAGPIGRGMADSLTDKVTGIIEGFPDSSRKQRVAIAQISRGGCWRRIEEQE